MSTVMQYPEGCEVLTEFLAIDDSVRRILELESEGWRLLFTLPIVKVIRQNPQYNYSNTIGTATNQSYVSGANGMPIIQNSSPVYQPIIPVDNTYIDCIQIVMVKKKWEQDPCPRCNHPYPDDSRIDRDI